MKVRHAAALSAAAVIATTGAVVLPADAAPHAASKGTASFLITEGGEGSTTNATAVVHGAITGGGKDVSKDNTDYDTLHLSGGTFRVVHPDKDATFKYKPDARTCFFSLKGSGTYTIAKGTGAYKGISGSGHYTIVGQGIAPKKNGSCKFQSNGGSFVAYVTGSGPVSLP